MTARTLLDDWLYPLMAGPQTAHELAKAMKRAPESAMQAMRNLKQRGDVQCTDKRPRKWELTDKGFGKAIEFFVISKDEK